MTLSIDALVAPFFFLTFLCVLVAGTIQILFYLFVFNKINKNKNVTKTLNKFKTPSVSIVICARNESENLQAHLGKVLEQDYEGIFEVVVVNDASIDDTEQILFGFANYYSHLRIINIYNKGENQIGKKYALSQGILAAQYEYLLLTDADCSPASPYWVRDMVQASQGVRSDNPYEIVLGYAPFVKETSFLNIFCRLECVYTALRYMSFSLVGVPYMGVGRNLWYKKSLFERASGFTKHEHIASGDDDLFINAVANAHNTTILTTTTSFIYSKTQPSWRAYYRQKTRHYTTGRYYALLHKILLGAESLTHIIFFLGGVLLLFSKFSTIFVGIWLVRIGVILYVYDGVMKKLQENDLRKYILLFDILLVIHYLVFAPTLFIGKTEQWK